MATLYAVYRHDIRPEILCATYEDAESARLHVERQKAKDSFRVAVLSERQETKHRGRLVGLALSALANATEPMRVADVAARTGIPKPTVSSIFFRLSKPDDLRVKRVVIDGRSGLFWTLNDASEAAE